jgi:UDP-3-O-[3-hydroxymyristoyl] glucosamine N-acyltransferase
LKLSELAARLGCRLEGAGDTEIRRVTGIEHAGPGDLTFFANPRYTEALRTTRAAAVILGEAAPAAPCAMLRTPHPYLAFAEAVRIFDQQAPPPPGLDRLSAIAPDAVIGEGVSIGPFVSIGCGARIGAGSVIYPNVSIGRHTVIGEHAVIHSHVAIRERSVIGDRVVIQNGAVIGSDGFGFARRPDGTHQKIPQIGIVVVEDDVEIGANTCIDRPAVGETRVHAGAKIDNLVQIAHGVRVGRQALLAAQVGIAGSTVIEDDVVLAGQVGVAGHLRIGRGVTATAQSGIPNSVKDGAFVSGYPAIENREWLKASAIFRRLPELKKTVAALERRIAALEATLARAERPLG